MPIGKSIEKLDGLAVTTCEGVYTDDHSVQDELYVPFMRSPHAFAMILEVDTAAA